MGRDEKYKRIDDDLAESLSVTQKNKRAGEAFVSDVRSPDGQRRITQSNKHDVETVRVEFELLYGDERFERTFVRDRYASSHSDTPSLAKLLDETNSSYDNIHSLFDSSVPVRLDNTGQWVLDFDITNDRGTRTERDEPTTEASEGSDLVVGVILLSAMVVIMAAVFGTFALDLGTKVSTSEMQAGVMFDTTANGVETTLVDRGTTDSLTVRYIVDPPNGEQYTVERTIDDTGETAFVGVADGSDVRLVVIGHDDGRSAVVTRYEDTV